MIQCHPTANALWEIVVCYKLCFVIFVKIFKQVSTKSLKDTHSKHICSFFRVVNMRGSIVISLYSWVCECPGKNFCSDSLVQMLRLFAKQLNLDYVIFFSGAERNAWNKRGTRGRTSGAPQETSKGTHKTVSVFNVKNLNNLLLLLVSIALN